MCKKHSHKCLCSDAVRYTYFNMRKRSYSSLEAMQSAKHVLKYHHPEISDEDVPRRIFSILISD